MLSSVPVACPLRGSVLIRSAGETLSLQGAGDKDSRGVLLTSLWDSKAKTTSFTCKISELVEPQSSKLSALLTYNLPVILVLARIISKLHNYAALNNWLGNFYNVGNVWGSLVLTPLRKGDMGPKK